MSSLAEKAAQRRADKIAAAILFKKNGTTANFFLSGSQEKAIYEEPRPFIASKDVLLNNDVKGDDSSSLKRNELSPLEDTIEIKPGIRIPRPTKLLSLEELIAIAQQHQGQDVENLKSMVFRVDGTVIRNYHDGTCKETTAAKQAVEQLPFNEELQSLVHWYRNEGPLPLAPFKRETGLTIKNHVAYYEVLNEWILQGPNGSVAKTGGLKKELELLKELGEKSKKK